MAEVTEDSSATKLTEQSSLKELAEALRQASVRGSHAVWSDSGNRDSQTNKRAFVDRGIHTLGDLLARPDKESVLLHLKGMGRISLNGVKAFLTEQGFVPEWPQAAPQVQQRPQKEPSRIRTGKGHGLKLDSAIEAADREYAAKTGEPVGDFSRKVLENTKALEDGARLKGRRTL